MSFFSFLGLGRRARDPLGRSPAQRIYIVDATGMVDNRSRNGNVQPSPRDHYLVLRNLAQFAGRERLAMLAVFIGRPLREAGEGREYKGVRVHYVEHADARAAKMLRLLRENIRARDVVLITADPDLEREAAALHAACMRPSTLRKAMDEREDRSGDRDRDGDRQQRYGRSRPPMDRRQEPGRQERQSEPERRPEAEHQPEPAQQRPPANEPARPPPPAEKDKPEPGVLDLIDPV